jgi:hypothetical protein
MNEYGMHDFFRKQELLRAQGLSPDQEPVERVEVAFDHFTAAKSGKSYGFFNDADLMAGGRIDWNAVVWIAKSVIEAQTVKVTRLGNDQGYLVNMPDWLANRKGVI